MACTGWVSWLVGASSHVPKCYQFDPQSGHIPRLWVPSSVGVLTEATNQSFSLTLMFFSLSSINTYPQRLPVKMAVYADMACLHP